MKKINELIILLLLPLLFSSCNSFSSDREWELSYIPVQIDNNDDPISLIDSKGNIVVKEEYNDDNTVSGIFKGSSKVYWVGDKEGKKQLYNLNDPKKPVTSEEYDEVTIFINDRAVVSREGSPIEIINNKGKVVATLPTTVTRATGFNSAGVAIIETSDNGKGWINREGKVVAQGFETVFACNNGLMIASKEDKEDSAKDIYSADGKKTGTIGKKMEIAMPDNYEPYIVVYRTDEEGEKTDWQVIDKTGKKKYDLKSDIDNVTFFKDGYIVFEDNERYGLINSKGEEVIRAKYHQLMYNFGKNQFVAQKSSSGDYGVINDKDETILAFDYQDIIPFGDNYIVKEKKSYNIINKDGKELLDGGFKELGDHWGTSDAAHFFDIDGLATSVVSAIDKVNLNQTAAQVAKALDRGEPTQDDYKYFITDQDSKIMGLSAPTNYSFDNYVVAPITHEESGATVLDKYVWNDSVIVSSVFMNISIENSSAASEESILKAVRKEMEKKGFNYNDGHFIKGDRMVKIKVEGYEYRTLGVEISKAVVVPVEEVTEVPTEAPAEEVVEQVASEP